jgi:hypothetical protein
MRIEWKRCETYKEARDYYGIIYLHEWSDEPFYWGKAEKSFFGGGKRNKNGLHASGRYNPGYRHWIEGCLRNGAKLYIGKLDQDALAQIDKVENFLIHTYGHVMNTRVRLPTETLEITHAGDVPASISKRAS